MNIGIAKETKPFEGRVALSPNGCAALIAKGHALFVEQNAGLLSGFSDQQYQRVGVTICATKALYQQAALIVRVKDPLPSECQYLTSAHTLFCFLHLAANETLAKHLCNIGLIAVAFEMVLENNVLSLLKPMSEIAGKLAVQVGTHLLHLPQGGLGLLLGGLDKTDKGQVVILGAGSAGRQSAMLAHSMGANVYVYDQSAKALAILTEYSDEISVTNNAEVCLDWLPTADLLVGALLVAGHKTPMLVTRSVLKKMKKGAVIVDISVDQGGCIETTRMTNYDNPTYVEEGITHFCVANMPGAVPRTATQAISELLPDYIHRLTIENWFENDKVMQNAVNIKQGQQLF